jgi:hypothetical protein
VVDATWSLAATPWHWDEWKLLTFLAAGCEGDASEPSSGLAGTTFGGFWGVVCGMRCELSVNKSVCERHHFVHSKQPTTQAHHIGFPGRRVGAQFPGLWNAIRVEYVPETVRGGVKKQTT